jgi:hypothetical protein
MVSRSTPAMESGLADHVRSLSFAAFDWTAPSSATYRMRVTFFESVITGTLRVSRK